MTRFKKMQRKLNKAIREVNKSIVKDDLWLGRYEIRQMSSIYHEYYDKSGGYIFTILRFIDKETMYYKDYPFDYLGSERSDCQLFWKMNEFIVEDTETWSNGRPVVKDYRKINIDHIKSKPMNYFLSEKYFNKESL